MEDNFKIHLFTPEASLPNEAAMLTRFLNAGLDFLHIRKPNQESSAIEALICNIPACFHSRLVLHDHFHLAQKYQCCAQLNSRHTTIDVNVPQLSRSCHSLLEVDQNTHLDFITLSPIYPSISKRGYQSHFEMSDLAKADLSKVVALGGVTIQSIPVLRSMGFAGAALLGEVWNRPGGENLFLKFLLMRNMSFQFITDGSSIEATAAQARLVLEAGGKWIQVRMKNSDIGEVRETLCELLPHCAEHGATLIVDDRFELADLCHGVHLGQNDAPVSKVRRLLSSDKIIGLTVNDAPQIRASLSALPDYYGVGPYRFTSTKKNLSPVLGLDGYRRLAPDLPAKFVAIGGILLEDIPLLFDAGASGVAVSSLITRSDNPFEQTKNLIHIINGQ